MYLIARSLKREDAIPSIAEVLVRSNMTSFLKVKFSPEQITKAQRRSRCIALLFLQPLR